MEMTGKVELKRVPHETICSREGCQKKIPFGVYAYINEDTGQAVCIDCGVEMAWTSKERATKIISALELTADVQALRREKKHLQNACIMLKKEVDLLRIGENYDEIEKQRINMNKLAIQYLQAAGSKEEKELFNKINDFIETSKERQQEIQEQISDQVNYFKLPLKRKKQEIAVET